MLIDGHVHFDSIRHYDRLIADMERTGAQQFNVLVIERFDETPGAFKQAEAIWIKAREPERAFAFGGLDYTGLYGNPSGEPEVPLVEQVKTLQAIGFDGLKMISGKPNIRHAIGRPLSDSAFTPMLEWLEETGFPVLWHVGDPPEFWDKDKVPRWACEKGWWYESNIPPKAQIDAEIAAVLQRHPTLNLILPHFFFLSDRLNDAAALLEKHPSFNLDLAPGVELLHNFTANWHASRDFFIRFANQIIFGTDIGLMEHCNSPDRGVMVRRFLETDDVFPVPDDPAMTPDDRPELHGLQLPVEVLEMIEYRNFRRVAGRTTPRPLDFDAADEALRRLADSDRRRGHDSRVPQFVLSELEQCELAAK